MNILKGLKVVKDSFLLFQWEKMAAKAKYLNTKIHSWTGEIAQIEMC